MRERERERGGGDRERKRFDKYTSFLHLVRLILGLSAPFEDEATELMLVDCFFMGGLGGGASSSSSLTACFLLDPP